MTMRDVHYAMSEIKKRKYQETELQASFFGHKLKPMQSEKKKDLVDMDDDQRLRADRAMAEAIKRRSKKVLDGSRRSSKL